MAAMQPVSIPFMCSNHQCIGEAGGREPVAETAGGVQQSEAAEGDEHGLVARHSVHPESHAGGAEREGQARVPPVQPRRPRGS